LRLRPYGATGRSASRSRSGLSAPVTISTSGPPTAPGTGWHRVARRSHAGRIRAGGVERDVTIEDADGAVNEQVDAAYRVKYRRYAGIVGSITNDEARSTTLRLVPRD
jgi:hypothetical protein